MASAFFLLLVVWWAWICTTWMVNWFDPASPAVRTVLTGVMLASLLMAAALPEALGEHGLLFAASYVALQVGRNAAAASLLAREHRLRDVFERLVVWSALTGVLWLAGAALDGDQRLLLWIPALAMDLAAPVAGYWLPGRGRAATTDYDIEGDHFAERCQLFIIIALGESIVVTGATAADAGLTSTVVLCLVVAFLETAALWWLYFGAAAERSSAAMSASDDPGRLARDAYTYLHLPIVAGIIATAVGANLLIAEPQRATARRRPGDDAWRARALPARREPISAEADLEDERQALDGRGAAHPALSARRRRRGAAARRDRDALLAALAVWELRHDRRSSEAIEHVGYRSLLLDDASDGDQPGLLARYQEPVASVEYIR